ncbi:MAG: M3 family metallopeptidase [Holosporales bacterium]|jgi:oligoendopeptidase F|nr:M3 family metallopeptidase [Holosporales bacterium]
MQNTWNLEDIYKSPKDEKLAADCLNVQNLVDSFRTQFKGNISLNNLKTAILLYEEIVCLLDKICAYSCLYVQTRLNDSEALSFQQEKMELAYYLNSQLEFFHNAVSKLNIEEVKVSCEQDKYLEKYGSWILNFLRYKEHRLSDDFEEAFAQKLITSNQSWIRMYDEILALMKFEFHKEEKSLSEILEIANHSEKDEERAEASKALSQKLYEESFYIKHIYNNVILDQSIENRVRNYEKPESFRHLYNNIEQKTVDYLTDSVAKGYERTSHRYYKLKAKILKKEKLKYWDRNVPVKLSDILKRNFDYDTGKRLVLETFGSFSEVFKNIASDFINKRWIDVYPKVGKVSGAFSHSCSVDVHPYILLNYFDTMENVSILAHELGHGIHQTLTAKNGSLLSQTPITLAEVASLFSEKLLFEKIFATARTSEEKIDLLCWKIDGAINSVIRQIAFFKFERKMHNMRIAKDLSTEDLSNIFLETQRECLGDFVDIDDCVGIYWTYITHFFHSPFYVYAYAFAEIFVNALYMNYKATGNEFVDKYINMLSKGGIDRYDVAAKNFGLDPLKKDFWENGILFIEEQIEYLEKLYNGKVCC